MAVEQLTFKFSSRFEAGDVPFVARCPECEAGKCGNCDGTSWNNELDCLAPCPCAVTAHTRRTA